MNMNRRTFVRQLAGTLSLAAAGGCHTPGTPHTAPAVAAQLYSIHKIFWQKPAWCLAGLKAGGYDGVEFAGYGGRSAKEIRALLADSGLKGMGTHVNGDIGLVGDNLKRTLEFCAEAGLESITTPHALRKTADEYRAFGQAMGLAAEQAAPYGIKVGIHTTYHHFTTQFAGVTAWDTIFSAASPLLQQQIDTSNVFHTGTDIVALLKRYPNRHFSVHLKENTPSTTAILGERPTDGGACVPWREVMAYLKREDVAWYVVEAEARPDTLEPLCASRQFLRQF